MLTRPKPSGITFITELWFDPRRPEDLFAPVAHSAAMLFAQVDRNRVRKCGQCVLHFYDTSKKALVQHATARKPVQGRCLRGSPSHDRPQLRR